MGLKPTFLELGIFIFLLKGFFDAEGCISKKLDDISIGQAWDRKDTSPLEDIKLVLEKLNIRCYLYNKIDKRPNRKPLKVLRISNRDGIYKFIKEIGSKHPEKLQRFQQFLDLFAPELVAKV